MSYLAPSPVGGGAASRWALLTQTDQGAAPLDPSGFAAPGTGFDASTGTFTWKMAGDVLRIDGYRESMVRWTVRIRDLYPDYDHSIDLIGVAAVPVVPVQATVAKYGVAWGLLNAGPSGIAGATGEMHAIGANQATISTFSSYLIGATAQLGGTSLSALPERAISTFGVSVPTTGTLGYIQSPWDIHMPGGLRSPGDSVNPSSFTTTSGDHYLHVGHVHVSTVSDTPTMSLRLWTRRIRTSGATGIP